MAKQVNRYRVFCTTESQYIYDWNDKAPTSCPNNNTHSIDTDSISIVDSVRSQSVNIIQEEGPTGGNYSCESYSMSIPPGQSTIQTLTWPFNISIASVHFTTDTTHVGDCVTSLIAPNTTIGVTTTAVNTGDTLFNVSTSVIQNIKIGMCVSLTDGSSVADVSKVYSIDAVANVIKCQSPTTVTFPQPGVAVRICYQNIKLQLGPPQNYTLGSNQIKSAFLPANTDLSVEYINKDETIGKTFSFFLQYYY